MAPGHTPSPGNAFSSGEPPMRMPHLELIYRVVALMGPGPGPSSSYSIPNVHGTGVTRLVLPIAGGTVRGPRISGEIVQNSGADWAQRIGGVGSGSTKVSRAGRGEVAEGWEVKRKRGRPSQPVGRD